MAEALDIQGLLDAALAFPAQEEPPEPVILTTYPFTTFSYRNLRPETALYFAREDDLRVEITSSVAGLVVATRARFLRTDGIIIPVDVQVSPTSNRVATVVQTRLGEGFMLNIAVSILTGTPQHGSVYASVRIARGSQASPFFLNQLVADYVTQTYSPGWPTSNIVPTVGQVGNIRNVLGTNPAAGAEISETVPTNARWRLHLLRFQGTFDGTAVTRRVRLAISQDGDTFYAHSSPATSGAGEVTIFHWCRGLGFEQATSFSGIQVHGLPDMWLPAGSIIFTSTVGLQAGDDFSAPQIQVEEWLSI